MATEQPAHPRRQTGAARMVDVTAKEPPSRTATATGRVVVAGRTSSRPCGASGVPKGDALAVARLAGIMGGQADRLADPALPPTRDLGRSPSTSTVTDESVDITATVRTTDRTGVEMEALTAVSVAALTVVDMVKAVDKTVRITDVRVERSGRPGRGPGRDDRDCWRVVVGLDAPPRGYEDATAARWSSRSASGSRRHRPSSPTANRSATPSGSRSTPAARVVLTTGGTRLTPTIRTPRK